MDLFKNPISYTPEPQLGPEHEINNLKIKCERLEAERDAFKDALRKRRQEVIVLQAKVEDLELERTVLREELAEQKRLQPYLPHKPQIPYAVENGVSELVTLYPSVNESVNHANARFIQTPQPTVRTATASRSRSPNEVFHLRPIEITAAVPIEGSGNAILPVGDNKKLESTPAEESKKPRKRGPARRAKTETLPQVMSVAPKYNRSPSSSHVSLQVGESKPLKKDGPSFIGEKRRNSGPSAAGPSKKFKAQETPDSRPGQAISSIPKVYGSIVKTEFDTMGGAAIAPTPVTIWDLGPQVPVQPSVKISNEEALGVASSGQQYKEDLDPQNSTPSVAKFSVEEEPATVSWSTTLTLDRQSPFVGKSHSDDFELDVQASRNQGRGTKETPVPWFVPGGKKRKRDSPVNFVVGPEAQEDVKTVDTKPQPSPVKFEPESQPPANDALPVPGPIPDTKPPKTEVTKGASDTNNPIPASSTKKSTRVKTQWDPIAGKRILVGRPMPKSQPKLFTECPGEEVKL